MIEMLHLTIKFQTNKPLILMHTQTQHREERMNKRDINNCKSNRSTKSNFRLIHLWVLKISRM